MPDVEEDKVATAIGELGTWQVRQLDLSHEVLSVKSWIIPRSMTRQGIWHTVWGGRKFVIPGTLPLA